MLFWSLITAKPHKCHKSSQEEFPSQLLWIDMANHQRAYVAKHASSIDNVGTTKSNGKNQSVAQRQITTKLFCLPPESVGPLLLFLCRRSLLRRQEVALDCKGCRRRFIGGKGGREGHRHSVKAKPVAYMQQQPLACFPADGCNPMRGAPAKRRK